MVDLDEARIRLATAESDAQKALAEAARIGRLLINDQGAGPFADASVRAMAERLEVLRHATHDLARVHASLRRLAAQGSLASPAGESDEPTTTEARRSCVSCKRADALVPVTICARCSGLGGSEEDEERWGAFRGHDDRSHRHR